jgi:quercetin dioxygenase-like cupin family protein
VEYVRSVDDDRLLKAEGRATQSLVDASSGAGNCAVSIVKTPPGEGSPAGLHTHLVDQVFFVLSGTMTVEVGGSTQRAGPGTLIVFPAGVPHRNWNDGDEPTLHLSIVAPVPDASLPFAVQVDGR